MIWLFDIDGTLIRCGGAGSLAMSKALKIEFGAQANTTGVSFSGRTDYAITQDLFRIHNIPFNEATIASFYAAYLKLLPSALDSCEGCVLPGACEWLKHLSAVRDCSVGIVTGNMKAAAEIKLDHFGLAQYFCCGGYGDSSPNRDDVALDALQNAKRYRKSQTAASLASVPTSKTWVVGDTPFDISCARSQDLCVIGVATGGFSIEELREHTPDLAVQSLGDISVLFDLLNA